MRPLLEQLAQLPGVVGAMACGPRGELLAAAFPAPFDELALHQVAALFSDDTAGLRKLAGPDGSLDLRYARGRALAKPFARGTVLVIGTPSMDAPMVSLSLEQAARRLDGAPAPAPAAAAAPPIPAEALQARGPLQDLLVSHIGPVGELIFAEAWASWAGAAPPSRAGLQRLASDLAREVDDEAERAQFLGAARAIIGEATARDPRSPGAPV